MKPIILCLIVFLLVTIKSFSQVVQKKQTTAPVIQKAELKKPTPQIKTAVVNPAIHQDITPKDTANAKLADAIIDIAYTDCVGDGYEDITRHYKPQIDLFDESNNIIAHWDFTNGIQNQYRENNLSNGNNAPLNPLHVTLAMKIDNTTHSFASLKSGAFKIHVERFFDQSQTPDGGDDCFFIERIELTLKYLNPSFSKIVYQKEIDQNLNLKNSSAEFYFSNKHYLYSIKPNR